MVFFCPSFEKENGHIQCNQCLPCVPHPFKSMLLQFQLLHATSRRDIIACTAMVNCMVPLLPQKWVKSGPRRLKAHLTQHSTRLKSNYHENCMAKTYFSSPVLCSIGCACVLFNTYDVIWHLIVKCWHDYDHFGRSGHNYCNRVKLLALKIN